MFHSPSPDALKIVVLAGGDSAERDVSLASGAAVAAALEQAGHHVSILDPRGPRWDEFDWDPFDACFIALHGGAGEDGRMQQHLQSLGMPYTGSGPAASRLAMSKSASKERFFDAGVPTPPYVLCHESDSLLDVAAQAAPLGYPLIVKPDSQGSSLGVGVAASAGALAGRLAESFQFDRFAIIEPRVVGREMTITVLERQALAVLEIVSQDDLFSYGAKYHSSATQYRFDPVLQSTSLEHLQQLAVAAAEALDTAGLVRVDMMLDRNENPWVLEVNTVPGMTTRSLAPMAAARAGIDFVALCDMLVRDSIRTEAAT